MVEDIVLTPGGKKRLEDELEHLRLVEMPALSERIRQARALGDLSENFDYQDAKRQQGFIAGRIKDLERMMDRATILPETVVTVRDLDYSDEFAFTLVGTAEADPEHDRISMTSPVGKALLGRKVGDVVVIETPGGKVNYEVIGLG